VIYNGATFEADTIGPKTRIASTTDASAWGVINYTSPSDGFTATLTGNEARDDELMFSAGSGGKGSLYGCFYGTSTMTPDPPISPEPSVVA